MSLSIPRYQFAAVDRDGDERIATQGEKFTTHDNVQLIQIERLAAQTGIKILDRCDLLLTMTRTPHSDQLLPR